MIINTADVVCTFKPSLVCLVKRHISAHHQCDDVVFSHALLQIHFFRASCWRWGENVRPSPTMETASVGSALLSAPQSGS